MSNLTRGLSRRSRRRRSTLSDPNLRAFKLPPVVFQSSFECNASEIFTSIREA